MDKSSFFAAAKASVKKKEIELPGIGKVFVRVLKSKDRDQYEADVFGGEKFNYDHYRAKLVQMCACDETGNLIFAASDVQAIGDLPADVVNAIFHAAEEVNGFNKKALEQAEKNSEKSPA